MRNRLLTCMTAAMAVTVLTLAPMTAFAQKVVSTTPGKGGSPHETVEYAVGDAKVTIVYGRPYLKGRTLATLAPNGKVWRTGADQATTLITTKDLTIGTLAVPAGEYTLYTLPSDAGWKLIVSQETKQWGTVYNEARDLGRVDMKASKLPTPADQLTVGIVGKQGAQTLEIHWADMRQSVPITLKK